MHRFSFPLAATLGNTVPSRSATVTPGTLHRLDLAGSIDAPIPPGADAALSRAKQEGRNQAASA